jgi:GT2 family glycosyltransferase
MGKEVRKPMQLVAVVVTYNRLAHLKVTLGRLLDSPALSSVLVFDNASDDGTPAYLEALKDPRLHVVASAANLGGAGGFEAAMRAAVSQLDPDWLVLMDDDARPLPGALEQFLNAPRHAYEAWAAAVCDPAGEICDMNRPWINPFGTTARLLRALTKGRNGFHMGADEYASDRIRPIDGGSFVGLFLSRAAIERAGFPDGRLFLYGDDVLYTLGLSQAGGRIAFDPALRFEHDCATLAQGIFRPLWKAYYFHRNQVLVYRRAAGPVLFWPVLALRALLWWRRARAYGDEAPQYRRLLRLALKDGLAHRTARTHPEILTLSSGSG